MWLTHQERATLAGLGLLALAALGVLLWQEHRRVIGLREALAPSEAAQWDQALEEARRVDINTAGVAELERLPHIGPALAARIVEDRRAHGPFRRPADLARVRGVGPKTVEAAAGYLTAGE